MDSKRYRSPGVSGALSALEEAAATGAGSGRLRQPRPGRAFSFPLLVSMALAARLGVVGCSRWGNQQSASTSESTFVATMADLRVAVQPGGVETTRDSAGRAAARDSILAKHGATAAALEQVARVLARNPGHAADIARDIDHKVESAGVVRRQATAPPPTVRPEGPPATPPAKPGAPAKSPPSGTGTATSRP